MPKITIINHGLTVDIKPARSLLNNFLVQDVPIHTVCGGHANCGCCRVRIVKGAAGMSPPNVHEIRRLGEPLLREGWRLACQSYCLRDIEIYLPSGEELASLCSKKTRK